MRYGSLFSGYGGLDMGVQSVLGGSTAWHVEFDKAPSAILAHHWPDVPNYGDITSVDWSTVEPVDVLTGGSPCQDLSHAGKRAGMTEGTRSNLWVQMREAIAALRPRLIVWENVRGALSAPADSEMEPCSGCVGGPDDGPVLRALGRVVGDLSELGYVGGWRGLRAADVGAAHGRFRVFLFAVPAADTERLAGGRIATEPERLQRPWTNDRRPADVTLLPTPAVNDMGAAYTPEEWDAWTATMQAKHGNGNGHGKSLSIEAQRLLPTPRTSDTNGAGAHGNGGPDLRTAVDLLPTPSVADVEGGRKHRSGDRSDELLLNGIAHHNRWGDYAPAIARWETVLGRPAPAPTEPGAKGNPRLSPAFCEWLMGLPEGHVTDPAIGLTRNQQLKALGNGVVPQQCAAATAAWVNDFARSAA
jgi:DNA (cytosine-5)-methyltransferase 1